MFVLFFSEKFKEASSDLWSETQQVLFEALLLDQNAYKFFAVDCDFHESIHNKSCIQILYGGKIIVRKVLTEKKKLAGIPVAQSKSDVDRNFDKPNNRVQLCIPCPGNDCSHTRPYDWKCSKCLAPLEFDFCQTVFCDCGKTFARSLEFKCTNAKHGFSFESHDPIFMQQLLLTHKAFKELNFLVLGETGVGKSTFINGCFNYLRYKTLKEAEVGDLLSVIPTMFTIYDKNKPVVVSTGTNENEAGIKGQSATQKTKVYPIPIGKTIIRLIDTPGIGDTRGYDQDKKNMENVLSIVANLKEIHGILILLKPNHFRLSLVFRFCIKELLTFLHKDASRNIVFCFTNSRTNFYRPGDTMQPLQALLDEIQDVQIQLTEHTIYCFDSEAYRYLAAVKNDPPIQFRPKEQEDFAASWEHSFEEMERLMKHIKQQKPHVLKSTVNLNHMRTLVVQLSRPLAEISRNIFLNKSKVEEDRRTLEKTDEDIQMLEARRYKTRIELEARKIDHPRTVCGHGDCKKLWSLGDTFVTEYVTICHQHCELEGVPADTKGDYRLINCWAINSDDGICRGEKCGLHYRDHLHIYYDSVPVERQVEDQSVLQSLRENADAKKMKQNMIDDKSQEIEEYEQELKAIEDASVKFAYLLKYNAITTYNDALQSYLEHLISDEQDKVAAGCSKTTLENLQKSLKSYIEQKRVLEQTMTKCNSGEHITLLDPTEMKKLLEELKLLKHSGKSLQSALACVNFTKSVLYREENTYSKIPKDKSSQGLEHFISLVDN